MLSFGTRASLWALCFAWLAAAWPGASRAAVRGLEPGAAPSAALPSTVRRAEGTVAAVSYRVAGGYPVTDVQLSTGDTFTLLGGMRDGVFWVAEEEAVCRVGDRVAVELEPGPHGWRARAVASSPGPAPAAAGQAGLAPVVHRFVPDRAPAVADADFEITIEGSGFTTFGVRESEATVYFQGLFEHVPATVLSWSDDRIRCLVPKPGLFNQPQILTGAVKVWTPSGGWSNGVEWEGPRFIVPFQFAGDRYDADRLPVPIHFDPTRFPWPLAEVRGVLERSAAAWNGIPGSFFRLAVRGPKQSSAERDRDGVNVVTWTEPWPHADSWLAVTWSAFDSTTGRRLETDIEINPNGPWSITDLPVSGAYDLRTVLTHEFGHWLRLGHVSDAQSAMHLLVTRSSTLHTLGGGDRAGAAWIYPSYGSAVAERASVMSGAAETIVLAVQVLDRLGSPRAGVPAAAVEAALAWRRPGQAGEALGFEPTTERYAASRDTDAEGRTEIVVPAPARPGAARFTITAGGTILRDEPVVTVAPAGAGSAASLAMLGAMPLTGTALSARLSLPAAASALDLRILDVRGRTLLTAGGGAVPAGESEIWVELSRGGVPLPSGVYFLEARAAGVRQVAKFVLVR